MGGKYKNYYKPLIDMGKPTIVYPISKNKETVSKEPINIDPKEILKLSKTKDISNNDCRKSIKALYNFKKSNKNVDDAMIMALKKIVWGCYKQNSNFSEGAFGVGDELKSLSLDNGKYGIGEFIQGKVQMDESTNGSIKKIIKENLIKTSVKKQNLLLSENKIIVNRYKLLSEGLKPENKKDREKLFDLMITETSYLHSQGYNNELIKEGFLDLMRGLFGNASTGVFQYFKEHIAEWFVKKFTPINPDSWMGNIIITTIGNVPLTELHNLTNCNYVSGMLSKSIAEGAVNKIKNEQGLTGPGYDILRNTLIEMAEDSEFGQKIEHKISEYICPKLQGLTSKLGDATTTIKSKALDLKDKAKNVTNKGTELAKNLVS
jgi:hypothetical protein